jgi:hypothetical protein
VLWVGRTAELNALLDNGRLDRSIWVWRYCDLLCGLVQRPAKF